ncbi:MAG: hypothetical protein BroJett011_07260 [Chloroflexota bacterium]|nr:MAG: hypothetical protein BroJett011_07260 [Chloroflexota bacterium]
MGYVNPKPAQIVQHQLAPGIITNPTNQSGVQAQAAGGAGHISAHAPRLFANKLAQYFLIRPGQSGHTEQDIYPGFIYGD